MKHPRKVTPDERLSLPVTVSEELKLERFTDQRL